MNLRYDLWEVPLILQFLDPGLSVALSTVSGMTHEWVKPSTREVRVRYTAEQVERGRKLVSRDDLLTNEKQRTRLEIGDLLVEIVGRHDDGKTPLRQKDFADLAAEIGLKAEMAREYWLVSSLCAPAVRERLAQSGVTISYSVEVEHIFYDADDDVLRHTITVDYSGHPYVTRHRPTPEDLARHE